MNVDNKGTAYDITQRLQAIRMKPRQLQTAERQPILEEYLSTMSLRASKLSEKQTMVKLQREKIARTSRRLKRASVLAKRKETLAYEEAYAKRMEQQMYYRSLATCTPNRYIRKKISFTLSKPKN